MNDMSNADTWRVSIGTVVVLTALLAFAVRSRGARPWWAIGGGLGLLLTAGLRGAWELGILLWSVPMLAAYFRHQSLGGTLFPERFATRDDIQPYLIDSDSAESERAILAGTLWETRWGRSMASWVALHPTQDRPEVGHGLVVAPTGLGKGLAIVTQMLRNTHHSVIVLDLKGEAYRLTSGARAAAGHRIVRVDLDGGLTGHRWDPTGEATDEDDLRVIAHALTHDPHDRDPFWAQAAEEMLTAGMLAGRSCGRAVFPFLRGLFDLGIHGAADLIRTIDPAIAVRFLPDGRVGTKLMLGVWMTLVARLRPLLTDRLLPVLAGADFAPADLRTERTTVYLTVPEASLERLTPALGAVWTGLITGIIRHADATPAAGHHPLLLILDEAGRIPIPRLPGYLATLRSRGVTCLVYVQSFSQLTEQYGLDQAQSISNNCALHVYYQQHDATTAWAVSRRLGETSDYARGYGVAETGIIPGGGTTTESVIERPRPLLTPQEVMRLPDDTILVFYRGLRPLWVRRLDWREHPTLSNLASLPPAALPRLATESDGSHPLSLPREGAAHDAYVDPDG